MSFSDHKITAFTHRIADLPDQPNLPADELKARFDSSPEQLRVSLNAVCDEAAALDSRVSGIVAGTFTDTITEEMLSDDLRAALDVSVTQPELQAEAAARQSADSALSTRVSSAESKLNTHTNQIAQKCEMYFGVYTGNGADSQFINLGFTPKAVLVLEHGARIYNHDGKGDSYGGLAMTGHPVSLSDLTVLQIETNGFRVFAGWDSSRIFQSRANYQGSAFYYLAIK